MLKGAAGAVSFFFCVCCSSSPLGVDDGLARKSHKPVGRDFEYGRVYHRDLIPNPRYRRGYADVQYRPAPKGQVMYDTQDFNLTPIKQVKQNISYAMIGLGMIRDVKIENMRQLSQKEHPLTTLDQAAYDTLIDDIKSLTFKIAILNTVAETLR